MERKAQVGCFFSGYKVIFNHSKQKEKAFYIWLMQVQTRFYQNDPQPLTRIRQNALMFGAQRAPDAAEAGQKRTAALHVAL